MATPIKQKLVYTNEIDENGSPVTGKENHIEDSATVYTFSIQIHKTNEDGAGLSGVTFDLYKKLVRLAQAQRSMKNIQKGWA